MNFLILTIFIFLAGCSDNSTSDGEGLFERLATDTERPQITTHSFKVNSGNGVTAQRQVSIEINATDDSKITEYCMKLTSTTPSGGDSCWVLTTVAPLSRAASTTLNVVTGDGLTYELPNSDGGHNIYFWLKDSAGNISANTAAIDTDRAPITLQLGTPPEITGVIVTNVDSPSSPVPVAELQATTGTSLYIKWNGLDAEALASTPVNIYSIIDGSEPILIAGNISNTANTDCSPDEAISSEDNGFTGCYKWTSNIDTHFRVKIQLTDESNKTASFLSSYLNLSNIRFLAGSTNLGTNSYAQTAMFLNDRTSALNSDSGSLVVTTEGVVYFRDIKRGILKVDPTDGIQRIFIPMTGSYSGDGNADDVTLELPYKMTLDYQGKLWIWDKSRILKVNINQNPVTVETVIGGGGSTGHNISPLDLQFQAPGSAPHSGNRTNFFFLPNGDLYFKSDNFTSTNSSDNRFRKFNASTGLIETILMTGNGNAKDINAPIEDIKPYSIMMEFNLSNSEITKRMTVSAGGSNCSYCGISNLNESYVSTVPHPLNSTGYGSGINLSYLTLLDGHIYRLDRTRGDIQKFNSVTNDWDLFIGDSSLRNGHCDDGTLATSCPLDPQDLFISLNNKIYFMDGGLVRYLDNENKVRTLMGQSYSYGNNNKAIFARFGRARDIKVWNNAGVDTFIVMDRDEKRIREFTRGGNITNIAGNGLNATHSVGDQASTSPIYISSWGSTTAWEQFLVHPTNGNIFYSNSGSYIHKLNRTTTLWEHLVGGGVSSYFEADGETGANIRFRGYSPILLGMEGNNIVSAEHYWTGSQQTDNMIKKYDMTTGTQGHLAGILGDYTSIATAGTSLNTAMLTRGFVNTRPSSYDSVGNRWYINTDSVIGKLTIIDLASNQLSYLDLPRATVAINYLRGADNKEWFYYCSTSGTLYKYNKTDLIETELTIPVAGIKCSGINLLFDENDNSLVFIYEQNGLDGVAEILNIH